MSSQNRNNASETQAQDLVHLSEDVLGAVQSESTPRLIQDTGHCIKTSLSKDWASDLGINKQSFPVYHHLITGQRPVVIDEPAIVIRPERGESDG